MLKSGEKELRLAYVDTLIELAENDPNVFVVEADLSGSIGTMKFKEKYPEQYINCGIMEAQMIGVAAGLSLTGKKPFCHTFASFASRRDFDQIFISLAYAGLSAVIVGSDPGITTEFNGGTHMPFEDVGIMRNMPNCNIVEASDEVMMKNLVKMSYEQGGLWYIRTSRKKAPKLYAENESFELGRAKVLKEGKDVCLMAYGISTAECMFAAEMLKTKGIDAAVIDMFSINPLDKDIVRKYVENKMPVVTVENHSITNGLGSAVSEVIAESGKAVKFARMGINGSYGQAASLDYLKKFYKIDKDSITEKACELVNR